MNRRKFIKKGLLSLATVGSLTSMYTWQIEPFMLEFVRKKMPVRNLPESLYGKVLMQISDVHVGNHIQLDYIIDSFKEAQRFKPDFVAYTGDFVSYRSGKQLRQLSEVFKFGVQGKLGTVGVFGNHDYGNGWSQQEVAFAIKNILRNRGVDILLNEKRCYGGMNFIGVDDFWGPNFDLQKAMRTYDQMEANVVLCHNPDVCDLDTWNGYQGWILSGHTHGGQCRPPFLPPPLIPVKNKKYTSGEIDLKDGRTLYINRALGHTMQVRFNVKPEITLFELCQMS